MPGNYNALAGFGMNPYDPRRDPREATFDGREHVYLPQGSPERADDYELVRFREMIRES